VNDAAVQAAMDKLIANYAGQKDIAKAVCQVADQYYQLQRHQQADKLYQKVVESCPKGEYSMWSQMHIAMSNIRDGNDAAEAAIDKLLTSYAGQENITEAVFQIADKYCDTNQYEKANQLYQYVIKTWSGRGDIDSRRFVAMSHIALGDYDAAAAIDKLLTDFSGHPDLAEAVRNIGYSYYTKARLTNLEGDIEGGKVFYRKAIEVWERLIREFPDSEIVPNAYYSSAVCYAQELEEYQKGIDYFQKVVNNWPNYEYARQARLLIVEYYNKMENNKNEK
jgi:tetratricopeptide (TPR) repeat protein